MEKSTDNASSRVRVHIFPFPETGSRGQRTAYPSPPPTLFQCDAPLVYAFGSFLLKSTSWKRHSFTCQFLPFLRLLSTPSPLSPHSLPPRAFVVLTAALLYTLISSS
jgi:hypothetical protein